MKIKRNLEDQVQYLTDRTEIASLGLNLIGFKYPSDLFPETAENGSVIGVGTDAPYDYYVYLNGGWYDIGVWPMAGPKGVPGDQGPQGPIGPVGPKGDKGSQGIAGPAGGGIGVDRITTMDLAVGSPSITYSNTTGATLSKAGQITAAGTNYDITISDKLPIIAGDNVNIAANTSNTAIKVSANVPVKSVNGKTGAVNINVPTKTSQLTNDSGYITSSYHDSTKQDTLVSGTNIKTINGNSLLGPGNITISGGGGSSDVQQTNGFYPYKAVVYNNPVVGTTYSYNDSKTDYSNTDCSYRQGQMIVDQNGVIYKVTATTMCECVYIPPKGYPNGITPVFSIVLPKDVTFPYTGTLTDEQKKLLSTVPIRAQVIDVQIAAENDLPDYNRHYLCSNDFINAQHGAYGSTYWAQYDDTKKIKVAFNYDTFTNKTYTISLVEAGGGNNVQQTNGFYQYNAAVTDSPTVGSTYNYTNSNILYPSGCSYFYGQMIIDNNGAIYRVTSSTQCKCVYAPQGGGSSGGALYQHNIETLCDPSTQVFITVYTSDNTPLNSLTPWQMKFGYDKVYGGGYVVYNQTNYFPILYTQASGEGVKSYYKNTNSMDSGLTATYQWGGTGQWTDTVREV